jgi:PAS domain S-box-containing protein
MSPLTIAQIVTASVLAIVGLIHLFVWAGLRQSKIHLLFAVSALGAGANAIAEIGFYSATTVETFNSAFRWANSFNATWLVAFAWFVVLYARSGSRGRWLAALVTICMLPAAVINAVLPFGSLYTEITGLLMVDLPWGEQIAIASGVASPWRLLSDVALVAIMVIVIGAGWRLWQQGDRKRALIMGGCLFLFAVLNATLSVLTDLGVLALPYLHTYGFLAVTLAMSYDLAGEVVRAARLSAQVAQDEQRWRTLLENVRLLVASVDREGRYTYANSRFCEISGYRLEELVGRSFEIVIPPEERSRFREGFQVGMTGDLQATASARLLTRNGDIRTVDWSSVLLYDTRGEIAGLISIGLDTTEKLLTEAQRDQALRDAEQALREVEDLKSRLEEEVIYLQDEVVSAGHFDEIVGESDALGYVLQKVKQVAPLDTTVLIEGETGAGKELIARAIHRLSPRSGRPMVRVNCGALPAELIESELFGHERGAFTGATRQRKGRFELADGGTIFLDEVSQLPVDLQGRLLRVLQEGELDRLGGERTLKIDVRVIAASNTSLQRETEAGRFREDLFYRLNVYPITVPTLSQRKEDIPLLVRAFVQRFAKEHRKQVDQIPRPVMDELTAYDWPGNVRELQNVIERAVVTSKGKKLGLTSRLAGSGRHRAAGGAVGYRGPLADLEKAYIIEVLESSGWRLEGSGGAAELLGLHPNTLRSRMRKLGIRRPD